MSKVLLACVALACLTSTASADDGAVDPTPPVVAIEAMPDSLNRVGTQWWIPH